MAKTLLVEIKAVATEFSREIKKVTGEAETFGSKLSGVGKAAALAGGVAGVAVLTEGLKASLEIASKDEQAMAKLTAAFKTAGLDAGKYKNQIDGAEQAGRQLGFTNEDTLNSFAKLIVPTKNAAEATKDLGVAMDIARFKHIDLGSASDILTRAMTGSQRALKQLGLTVPPVTEAVDAYKQKMKDAKQPIDAVDLAHAKLTDMMSTKNEIIDLVSEKMRGQGQAFADTAAGGMAQFRAQLDNVLGKIGEKLLPILDNLLQWVNTHWPEIDAAFQTFATIVGQVIDTVTPIIKGLATVVKGVVEIVSGLLTGDFSKVWNGFKTLVSGVMKTVEGAVRAFATVISTVLKPPVEWIGAAGSKVWSTLSAAAEKAFAAIKTAVTKVWDPAYGAIKTALVWIRDVGAKVWGALKGAIEAAWKALQPVLDFIRGAIDAVASAIQKVVDAWNALSSLGGGGPTTKQAPGPPPPSIGTPGLSHTGGMIFHAGGAVRMHWGGGLGIDEVPAILQRGEYVLQRSAVRAIGVPNLDALNTSPNSMIGRGWGEPPIIVQFHGGTFIGGDKERLATDLEPALSLAQDRARKRYRGR